MSQLTMADALSHVLPVNKAQEEEDADKASSVNSGDLFGSFISSCNEEISNVSPSTAFLQDADNTSSVNSGDLFGCSIPPCSEEESNVTSSTADIQDCHSEDIFADTCITFPEVKSLLEKENIKSQPDNDFETSYSPGPCPQSLNSGGESEDCTAINSGNESQVKLNVERMPSCRRCGPIVLKSSLPHPPYQPMNDEAPKEADMHTLHMPQPSEGTYKEAASSFEKMSTVQVPVNNNVDIMDTPTSDDERFSSVDSNGYARIKDIVDTEHLIRNPNDDPKPLKERPNTSPDFPLPQVPEVPPRPVSEGDADQRKTNLSQDVTESTVQTVVEKEKRKPFHFGAKKEFDPFRVFLRKVSSITRQELIVSYLEYCCNAIPIEIVFKLSGALVLFSAKPDIGKLLVKVKEKPLEGHYIQVARVSRTHQVLLSGLLPSITSHMIKCHFDTEHSGGSPITDVIFGTDKQLCVVTFVNVEDAERACKRPHIIDNKDIQVCLYFECLDGDFQKYNVQGLFLVLRQAQVKFIQIYKEEDIKALEKRFENSYVRISIVDHGDQKGIQINGTKDGCNAVKTELNKLAKMVMTKEHKMHDKRELRTFLESSSGRDQLNAVTKKCKCILTIEGISSNLHPEGRSQDSSSDSEDGKNEEPMAGGGNSTDVEGKDVSVDQTLITVPDSSSPSDISEGRSQDSSSDSEAGKNEEPMARGGNSTDVEGKDVSVDQTGLTEPDSSSPSDISEALPTYKYSLSPSVVMEIVQGDITKETTDVIINSVLPNLDLSKGQVSKAILTAGGNSIQQECLNKFTNLNIDGFVETKAGQMPCKMIIHVLVQDKRKDVEDVIKRVLHRAEMLKYQSISFPAIGTGGRGLPEEMMVKAIYKAFREFACSEPKFLKKIRLVVLKEAMFNTIKSQVESKHNKPSKLEKIKKVLSREKSIVFSITVDSESNFQDVIRELDSFKKNFAK